jgi:hypothetical protein
VKNTFKLSAVLLSILAILIMMFPGTATAAALPTYPTSINGMPVVLVETSANNVSLAPGQIILVLLDNTSAPTSASELESEIKLNLKDYLKNNLLPDNTCIEVCGGPNITKESIFKLQKENNDWQKKSGDMKLGSIDAGGSAGHTFEVDMNLGPQTKTLDRQSCNIIAPIVRPNIQNHYSYFGDNVRTNGSQWRVFSSIRPILQYKHKFHCMGG